MGKPILVAPSILSADFSRLAEEIKKIEDSGGDIIHIDVMDGHFAPNITIGPFIIKAMRKCTNLPLDAHLMIKKPHKYIEAFALAGSDIITIHAEAYGQGAVDRGQGVMKGASISVDKIDEEKVKDALNKIKSFGKKAGISINPNTPVETIKGVIQQANMVLIMSVHPGFSGQAFIESALSKIKELREFYTGDIQVDGGINDKNVDSVIKAGANILVAGSYFFSAEDPKEAVRKLRIIK